MDSFELNKVAGAVLGTLLLAVGSGFVAELIYHSEPAGNAGYALPEPTPAAEGGGAAAETAKAEPLPVLLASASVEKGQAGTKVCQSCHNFEKGGPNKVGPGLWDVVERPKAQHAGFEYSAALKEKGGTWTDEDLDHFLANPKGYAKGTKMAFQGIASPQDRANVIAYLHTLADDPKPLPAVETKAEGGAAGKAAEGKPAEAKPSEVKPSEVKPNEVKPAEAGSGGQPSVEAKPGPAAPGPAGADTGRSAAGKAGADAADTAGSAPEVRPGEGTTTRNEVGPTQPPEAETSQTKPVEPTPAPPPNPVATEPPAKADPAAVQRAEEERIGKDKPAQP